MKQAYGYLASEAICYMLLFVLVLCVLRKCAKCATQACDPFGRGRGSRAEMMPDLVVGGDDFLLSLLGVHQHIAYPGIFKRSPLPLPSSSPSLACYAVYCLTKYLHHCLLLLLLHADLQLVT